MPKSVLRFFGFVLKVFSSIVCSGNFNLTDLSVFLNVCFIVLTEHPQLVMLYRLSLGLEFTLLRCMQHIMYTGNFYLVLSHDYMFSKFP